MPRALQAEPDVLRRAEGQEGGLRRLPEGEGKPGQGRGPQGLLPLLRLLVGEVQGDGRDAPEDGRGHLHVLLVPRGDTEVGVYIKHDREPEREAQAGDAQADPRQQRGQRHDRQGERVPELREVGRAPGQEGTYGEEPGRAHGNGVRNLGGTAFLPVPVQEERDRTIEDSPYLHKLLTALTKKGTYFLMRSEFCYSVLQFLRSYWQLSVVVKSQAEISLTLVGKMDLLL